MKSKLATGRPFTEAGTVAEGAVSGERETVNTLSPEITGVSSSVLSSSVVSSSSSSPRSPNRSPSKSSSSSSSTEAASLAAEAAEKIHPLVAEVL